MQTSDNVAEVQSANSLDKFSMERVKMVARYYYPLFRNQLWIYPLVGLLVGVLFHLRELLTIFDVFFALLSLAMSFMVYWAPIVLTGKDRTTDILLPARWSEKSIVLLVYFLVVIPALTYAPYYLSNGLISFLRTDTFTVNVFNTDAFQDLVTLEWLSYPLTYLNMVLPISIFLFIVSRTARPKAWQGLLFSVLSNFAMGIAIGIYVVARAVTLFSEYNLDSLSRAETERLVFQSIDFDTVILGLTAAFSLASLLFIGLTVRAIRKIQA